MSTAENFTVAPQTELAPWAEEMLKEQEQAPPQQQDPAASDVVLFQVPSLAANDADGLATLLAQHPDLYEQILAAAAGFLGNDTVVRALEIRKQQTEASTAQPEPQAETTPPTVVAEQAAEHSCGVCDGPVCVCKPAQEEVVEPGWVVRARAFNANHEDQVNLFNIATGFACRGPDGQPDPNAIANWQSQNGVDPDGRVGQETADRAWLLMPVEAPQTQNVATEPPQA